MIKTNLKEDLKKYLNIEEEDEEIEILVETSYYKILQQCNRKEVEIEEDKALYKLIFLDSVISYNKMHNEGIESIGTSGFSKNYALDESYKHLLRSCNRLKVL